MKLSPGITPHYLKKKVVSRVGFFFFRSQIALTIIFSACFFYIGLSLIKLNNKQVVDLQVQPEA